MPADFDPASILVLGSGTSVGVPMIGCSCKVCKSDDPRDKRLRPSVLLSFGEKRVLIDTSPDFRYQALRAGMDRLDAILYTHSHADHILGLDDVRPFNFMQKRDIPIFASLDAFHSIQQTFGYVFEKAPSESSRPRLAVNIFDSEPVSVAGLPVQPIRVDHGKGVCYGFRFGNYAYLTDHSGIPPKAWISLPGSTFCSSMPCVTTPIPPIPLWPSRSGLSRLCSQKWLS